MGSSKSKTIFAWSPRKASPITSLTCSSRQARTQRVHWMHASRLTAMPGWDTSAAGWVRPGNRGRPTSSFSAHWSSSESTR